MAAPLPPYAAALLQPGHNVLAEKYVLESIIGRGGMGFVVAARHLTLGKRVAVKLLLSEADENTRARFHLEAQAAAQLSSPNIAQVLDFGFTRERLPYLVMEFLEGMDLAAMRKQRGGALPIVEAVDLVVEASLGLAHAHAAGLVHRDVKPANVFVHELAGRRTVKVLDFGLIKVMDDAGALTGTRETFGTPKYMAPEQIRSARLVDERSDQHAIAAVLFELVAGRPPFVGDTVPEIILAVGTEPAPTLASIGKQVPRAFDDALQRALAKRPEDRFANLADLADALAPFGSPHAARLAAEIRACLTSPSARRVSAAEMRQVQRASMPGAASAPSAPASLTLPTSAFAAPPSASTQTTYARPAPSVHGLSVEGASADASTWRLAPAPAVVARPVIFAPGASDAGSLSAGSFAAAATGPAPRSAAWKIGIGAAAVTVLGAAVLAGYFAASRGDVAQTPPDASSSTHVAPASEPPSSPVPSHSSLSSPESSSSSPSVSSLPAASSSSPPPAVIASAQPPVVQRPTFVPPHPSPAITTPAPRPTCTGGLSCY